MFSYPITLKNWFIGLTNKQKTLNFKWFQLPQDLDFMFSFLYTSHTTL